MRFRRDELQTSLPNGGTPTAEADRQDITRRKTADQVQSETTDPVGLKVPPTLVAAARARSKSVVRLAACLAMCLGIGLLESLITKPEIPTWYASLIKPSWTPPPVVFPIAWTALYVLMAVSFWRLWETEPRFAGRSKAMVWFLVQLALNASWSPVFFALHDTRIALVIIMALLIAIGATIICASRVDRTAAWLLAPYLAWVTYATTINAGVVALN